jgi:hypothetical protein
MQAHEPHIQLTTLVQHDAMWQILHMIQTFTQYTRLTKLSHLTDFPNRLFVNLIFVLMMGFRYKQHSEKKIK